jgi:bacterioferritin-associated ferredoxin
MEKKNLVKSCCINKVKAGRIVKNSNLCPVCGKTGDLVKNITIKHMVLNEVMEQVGDKDYYLCRNEECDVVYYNTELNIKFKKEQVKVPIWFKKEANPKYACYCSKVTEEQVINAVINNGAKSVKDIINLTGAMKDSDCEKNNPLGKCCHQIIQEAIDKGLSMK